MGNGSCLCGGVKYTFTGPPASQVLCHCLTCRKVSGSTNATLLVIPRPSFTITAGTQTLSSYSTLHESGMMLTLHWCSKCGTNIYKESDAEGQKGVVVFLFAGTIDGEGGVESVIVEKEFYIKDRVGWLGALEGVEQCQKFV